MMDANLHKNQYPKLFETNEDVFNQTQKKVEEEDEEDEVKDLIRYFGEFFNNCFSHYCGVFFKDKCQVEK